MNQNTHHYFGQADGMYVSTTDYGNNTVVGKYVTSNGARIYYEVYGQGTPIVLLHGGLVGSPAEMGELADHLKDNHQVILIATRGHGRSEIGHTTMSFEQKVDDVHAVLKDGADVFDAVKAKTLVLAGEKDANAPLQTVIDAYHLLPDAELGIVPNAPHPVLTTDFDQAWPMIEKFLAK